MTSALTPFLLKSCPTAHILDPKTGLCLSPWPYVGAGVGITAAAIALFPAVESTDASKRLIASAITSLGIGLFAGLLAKSFQPLPVKPVIHENVANARRMQDARRLLAAPVVSTCETGCICNPDWCAASQNLIRPNEVAGLVQFVPVDQTPPEYVFANDVAQWISYFTYAPDPVMDTWCPPSVTLAGRSGDCEDLSMLCVSLLLQAQITASLVCGVYNDPSGPFGHAWVEGTDQYGWFLIEATDGNLFRGSRPAAYAPTFRNTRGACSTL